MGWWEQSEEGVSFAGEDRKPEPLMWGDEPADIIDNAIWQIKAAFVKDLGRLPSVGEIMAGITFSTAGGLDLPDRPEDSPRAADNQHEAIVKHYYRVTGGDKPIPTEVLMARRLLEGIITKLQKPFTNKGK